MSNPNSSMPITPFASTINTANQHNISPLIPALPPPHSPKPIPLPPPYETDIIPHLSISPNKRKNKKRMKNFKIENKKDVQQYITTHDYISYDYMQSFVNMNHITLKKIKIGSTEMYQISENILWIIIGNQYIKLQTALTAQFNTSHEMYMWKQEINKYASINDAINIIFKQIESTQSNKQQLKSQLSIFIESIKNHNWKFKKMKYEKHVKTKENAIEFLKKNKTIDQSKMDNIINKYNILKEKVGLTDMYNIENNIWIQYGKRKSYHKVTEQLFKSLKNNLFFDGLMFKWKKELEYMNNINMSNISNIIDMINNYEIDTKRNNKVIDQLKHGMNAKSIQHKHEEVMRNFYENIEEENSVDGENETEINEPPFKKPKISQNDWVTYFA